MLHAVPVWGNSGRQRVNVLLPYLVKNDKYQNWRTAWKHLTQKQQEQEAKLSLG